MDKNPILKLMMKDGAMNPLAMMKQMVCITLCCSVFPIVISATFCGLYWTLWASANKANDSAVTLGYAGAVPLYDTCGLDPSLGA